MFDQLLVWLNTIRHDNRRFLRRLFYRWHCHQDENSEKWLCHSHRYVRTHDHPDFWEEPKVSVLFSHVDRS